MLLADIASGEVDAADVFFLIGLIVALLAAVVALLPAVSHLWNVLMAVAVAAVALAWLLL